MSEERRKLLQFSKAENFRQLGGLPAADGKTVRYGLFWRCGALEDIETEEDRQLFESLGIHVVCDLRSSQERELQPDPDFPGVTRHAISAIVDEDGKEINFNPTSFLSMTAEDLQILWEQLHSYYENMPFHNEAYRTMFAEIKKGNLPLLFHCSAGKDRTGIASALILLALGASRKTVREDFLLTNQCRPKAMKDYADSYAKMMERDPGIKSCMQAMGGVEESNLNLALDAIDRKYPDLEDYFEQELDVTRADLAAMRAACLE